MLITPLLSKNSMIDCFCRRDILSKKNDNYIICYTVMNTAIYFASVITVSCLFFDYKTGPSSI